MAKVSVICAHCGKESAKDAGCVNRSKKIGAPIYCGRECSGIARRVEKSRAQKIAEKAEYDRMYRAREAEKLRVKKAEYYQRTADRDKEREARKRRMPAHVEYCRRPEYKEWKAQYDQKYRARKWYGDFGEAAIILNILETEINSRISWIERRRQNGTLNKHQTRRRDYERQTQRR